MNRAGPVPVAESPKYHRLEGIHERIGGLGANLMQIKEKLGQTCGRLFGPVTVPAEDPHRPKMAGGGKLDEIEEHLLDLKDLTNEILFLVDALENI